MIGCHGNGSKCSKTWISLIPTWIISSLGSGQQLLLPGPRFGRRIFDTLAESSWIIFQFLLSALFCSDSASGSKFDAGRSLKSKLSLK